MFDELRELYQEVILDHGKNPRNYRELPGASCQARGDNPICGDKITVFLKLDDDGLIEDASFQGRGCAISQASASMMTEIIAGRTVENARSLFERFHKMVTEEGFDTADIDERDADAFERLQVLSGVREFPMRVKCATLAWHTMQAAVHGDELTTTE
jgi:nitrogen fixation NifU-like protein